MAHTVSEGADAIFTGSLVDSSSDGVTSLTRLTITYYDRDTGTIINGRNAQNICATVAGSTNNNISVSATGLITWRMQPADNVIVSANLPTGAAETHVALFEFGWNSSEYSGAAEEVFTVTQRAKIG
ncbi:MAG: hypothetical protein PHR30_16540 [Gallionellaceae bacterium]|nr:hypothetical protein [Gallionellaceae bacterium]